MNAFINSLSKVELEVILPNGDNLADYKEFSICNKCGEKVGLHFVCPWYGWWQDLNRGKNCIFCGRSGVLWMKFNNA